MAKSKTAKVNYKALAKEELYVMLKDALTANGLTVVDGADLDFTTKTIVVRGYGDEAVDVSITLVTPKAGEMTYDYKMVA